MDWNLLSNEAVKYLQDYIRINTVNPPGNEIEGVRFFQKIFAAASVPFETFEPSPGRGTILAVLKGKGKKRPLLLLNHIDVVPAEKQNWDVDPFAGVVKDGYVYGRGALDDKSMGIVEMMVLLILKREGGVLDRDILFLAAGDEEVGGKWGAQWAVQNLPAISECEYALNEGGYIILDENGVADRYEISSGQKVILQFRLKASGTSGHASMPMADNPNEKLVHALETLTRWETPYEILPMVKDFFRKLAPKEPPDQRTNFEDIEKGLRDPSFSRRLSSNPAYNAMIRNTVALTVLQSGSKVNVVPSESSALVDCRLLPGTSKEDFLREVRQKLGAGIEVEVLSESYSLPPSPLDTPLFAAIQNLAAKSDPGCPVVPYLLPGGTDGRFLREKGIITYDFCPFRLTQKEMLRVHGNNERIAVENLEFGMKAMTQVIREIAT